MQIKQNEKILIMKQHLLISAVIEGRFEATDFNGEKSGYFHGLPLRKISTAGEQFSFGASPHSRRDCRAGHVRVEVREIEHYPETDFAYTDYEVWIKDSLGEIGTYPDFEWHQEVDASGGFGLRLFADGSWDYLKGEIEEPQLGKILEKCQEALNELPSRELLDIARRVGVEFASFYSPKAYREQEE